MSILKINFGWIAQSVIFTDEFVLEKFVIMIPENTLLCILLLMNLVRYFLEVHDSNLKWRNVWFRYPKLPWDFFQKHIEQFGLIKKTCWLSEHHGNLFIWNFGYKNWKHWNFSKKQIAWKYLKALLGRNHPKFNLIDLI